MRKALFLATSLFAASLFASAEVAAPKAGEVEKKGFLATEACMAKGLFKDCRLDTMSSALEGGNTKYALFVHDEGATYKLDSSNFHAYELDEAIGKNNVTIIGKLEGNVIKVQGYQAPPPESKSFFKGCL